MSLTATQGTVGPQPATPPGRTNSQADSASSFLVTRSHREGPGQEVSRVWDLVVYEPVSGRSAINADPGPGGQLPGSWRLQGGRSTLVDGTVARTCGYARGRDGRNKVLRSELAGPELDEAWECAMNLAWESFRARTTPVGAVVVNASGTVVAEGRGRRYEQSGPSGQLARSHIAHAEVNALAQLGAGRHYQDHMLLTTLEPCGMCHGAAVQATVGCVLYAGSDPYGGTGSMVFGTPQAEWRRLRVIGPLDNERGRLAALLHIVWLLRMPAGAHVLAAQRSELPALTSLAERPATQQLFVEAAAGKVGLAELRTASRGAI